MLSNHHLEPFKRGKGGPGAGGAIAPSLRAGEILAGWQPRRVGRSLDIFSELSSTNTVALAEAVDASADGRVILADLQTAGRGRLGRRWHSPRGASILCSVTLMVEPSAGESSAAATGAWMTQAAAIAVCQAVQQGTALTPAIKWPNDIRHEGRKLGGILIESRPLAGGTWAWVMGIGLNCLQQPGHFPPELRSSAVSLDMLAPHAIDRTDLTRRLLQHLDHWCTPPHWLSTDALHRAWLGFAEPPGRRIRLRNQGQTYEGWVIEVDPAGGLSVRLDRGPTRWFDPMTTSVLD